MVHLEVDELEFPTMVEVEVVGFEGVDESSLIPENTRRLESGASGRVCRENHRQKRTLGSCRKRNHAGCQSQGKNWEKHGDL